MGTDRRDRDVEATAAATDSSADPLAVTVAGAAAGDDPGGPAEAPLLGGTRVGRYVVTGVLGQGGMGVVYAAHDPDLDRPVAIKLLRRELRSVRVRLLREGQAIARLTHPNVVVVHDVGTHGDDLFIAMEWVRGQTLGAWMRAGEEGRRPWRDVLARLLPAGRGLIAAHAAGLVHRDFKPENVLLGDDGRVVVTDFGLAQVGDEPPPQLADTRPAPGAALALERTHTGAVLGTPAYMSPEQGRGDRADARSDQFSFCVTLHEAVFGKRPFLPRDGAPTLTHLATGGDTQPIARVPAPRHAPRWLRRAIARGLSADAVDRFPSMTALMDALRPPRRRRWPAIVIAAAVIGGVIALALASRGGHDDAGARERARCDAAATAGGAVWTPGARAEYQRVGRITPMEDELAWLDDYVARWSSARRDACLAAPGAAPRRTEACLDDALGELRVAIERPDVFWPALPSLEDCRAAPRRPVIFPVTIGVGPQGVAVLSPDAHRLAVSGLDGEPYLISADPRQPQATPVSGARVVGDWLPDDRLLLQLPDGRQVLRPAAGGADVALPGRGDLLFTQINTITADGARLAVADDQGVTVLDTATGAARFTVPGPAHELAWEPDGHRLAIVARDLGALTLLDTRDGRRARVPIGLHSRGMGEIGLAWLAPGRLVLSGAIGASVTFGVWTLELDQRSRLTRAPELRFRPARNQLLRLFDAAAGRVLFHDASGRQRLLRWRGDRISEYPASFKDVRIVSLDRTTGTALGLSGDHLHVFDVDSGARTMVAADDVTHALGGLRAGRAYQARRISDGRWELIERTPGGDGERIAFAWPSAAMPQVRCAPGAPEQCVLISRGGDVLHVAPFDGARVGAARRIDGITGTPDVSADGTQLFAPATGARVVAIDLGSGAVTPVAETGQPCAARIVRQDPADPDRFWMVLLCADRFAIGQVARTEPYREVTHSDGWISGLEVLAGGDLVYSAMDWDPQLQLLEGL